jgi:arsenate reductase-like glutaredoxin family protein
MKQLPKSGARMRFFGLKTCETCRKALVALREAGHDPVVTDVRADGISPADLALIVGAFGDEAINRSSTTWRGLDDAARRAGIPDLLRDHPTVMKRPVIEHEGIWFIGWSKANQAALLGTASSHT